MWKNEVPTKDGYYWVYIKRYIDGELIPIDGDEWFRSKGPSIGFIYVNDDKSVDILYNGSDDPDGCTRPVYQGSEPRDIPFMWDSEEVMNRKREDLCMKRIEYWFMKIDDPKELP